MGGWGRERVGGGEGDGGRGSLEKREERGRGKERDEGGPEIRVNAMVKNYSDLNYCEHNMVIKQEKKEQSNNNTTTITN